MTAFIRMQPGSTLDAHFHTQTEECLIVEGEIFIGAHRLCALDMHVAAGGTAHAPITSPRGALILVRAQALRMPEEARAHWRQKLLERRCGLPATLDIVA